MKSFLFSLTFFLLLPTTTQAQSLKTITLKDGSLIKGKIISLTDQVYTIETEALGPVKIPDSQIQSISDPSTDTLPSATKAIGPSPLRLPPQGFEKELLSDPSILLDIQKIVSDEELIKTISDKKFLDDLMSRDQQRIESNEDIQHFIDDPQIKSLMDKIKVKIEAKGTVTP